jgi:hypothetical protein
MNTTQKFHDSVLKHQTRRDLTDKIFDQFGDTASLNIWTLPADVLEFEARLMRYHRGKVEFFGVEKDKQTYARAWDKAAKLGLPLTLERMYDLDYWDRPAQNKLDFIWLDRCSPYCSDVPYSLDLIFENGHLSFKNGNPIIALTVLAARETHENSEYLRSLVISDFYKSAVKSVELKDELGFARHYGIPRELNRVAQTHDHTLVLQSRTYYKDSIRKARSTPMLLFVFEVHKGIFKYNDKLVPTVRKETLFDFH